MSVKRQRSEDTSLAIKPPKPAKYLTSHNLAADEPVGIGKKPDWGKDKMGTDIMFKSTSQLSLDSFRPMERVALNASGTFQKTVSSYYNSPVYVETDYNNFLPPKGSGKTDRQVTMSVGGYEFAVCTTYTEVTRADVVDAMENKGFGIGQLVRQFELMPVYKLLAAGLDDEQPEHFLWRVYTLSVEGVFVFTIHEKIRRDCFDLKITKEEVASTGGGYVVKPNVTYMELPEGFSKFERILLVSNVNVERIVGSYYNMPTTAHVMQNYRREPCVFERRTAMLLHGEEFMLATSTIFLADKKWEDYLLNHHKAQLGDVFTMMKVQPTFKLRDAGRTPHSFWRQYTLTCPEMTVQLTESFNMDIFALDESQLNSSKEYAFKYSDDTAAHAAVTIKKFEPAK